MNVAEHTRSLLVAALIAVALLAAGAGLAACGDDDEPTHGSASPTTTQQGGNGVDLAFVRDMIPHHEGAIEMAEVARERGRSSFVKDLAEDIIRTQEEEIATLREISARLEASGVRKAGDLGIAAHEMGMDGDMTGLRQADQFDRAFIDMMVPHHQGAIRMARAVLAKGGDAETKRLAQAIIDAQAREIEAMNDHREEEFGAPSPAGDMPGEADAESMMDSGGHGG